MSTTTVSPQLAQLLSHWMQPTAAWFEQQAYRSVMRGWFREILGASGDLYLLRCWLVEPVAEPNTVEKFESGNSVLLHYFPQPDHDRCLHDHPWAFTTTILAGGYTEIVPANTWSGKSMGFGPSMEETVHYPRYVGATIERAATDLHLVGELTHNHAWTLVRTGPRVREWGFHPPGEPWMAAGDYFATRNGKAVA